MNFMDAIKSCFSQYVGFSGRASRSELWWFFLFTVIVYIVAGVIDGLIGMGIVGLIAGLAIILPSIAVGVRRLHDIGMTGWWYLIYIIPIIGLIAFIYFGTKKGDEGDNEYGADPLA